jgi:hypothetical protein
MRLRQTGQKKILSSDLVGLKLLAKLRWDINEISMNLFGAYNMEIFTATVHHTIYFYINSNRNFTHSSIFNANTTQRIT